MNRLLLTITLVVFVFSANANSCNVKKDNEIANFSRCLALAKEGDADAQFDVAYKYYYGIDVPRDLFEAFKWYKKSAVQGNYLAQNILGSMFYNGDGVHQNYKQAMNWYMKSAEQGHPYAPFHICEMYYLGEGVPQGFLHSLMWCYIAEKKGIKKAGKFRFELEKKMMFDQIIKARALSKAWMARHNQHK